MDELIKYIFVELTGDENLIMTREADTVTVKVKKADMGKVIGRQGRIAKAIRTVIKAAAKNERIILEIAEIE